MAPVGTNAGSGLFKFLKPRMRPQSTDIQAAALWGFAAASTAIYLVQLIVIFHTVPRKSICLFVAFIMSLGGAFLFISLLDAVFLLVPFDWIKKTFFEKPQPEVN